MDLNNQTLMSLVVDILSRTPNLTASKQDICEQLSKLMSQEQLSKLKSLEDAVKFAIDLGYNMGLISRELNGVVRLRLAFRPGVVPERAQSKSKSKLKNKSSPIVKAPLSGLNVTAIGGRKKSVSKSRPSPKGSKK